VVLLNSSIVTAESYSRILISSAIPNRSVIVNNQYTKTHNANRYFCSLIGIALIWILLVMCISPSAHAAVTSKFDTFLLTVDSSKEVIITATATGWSVQLYGSTTSDGCGGSNHSAVQATFTISNTDPNRGVSFKISVTSTDASPSGAPNDEQRLAANSALSNFTATSGSGSSNFTTVDITFSSIKQDSLGVDVITTVKPTIGGSISVDGTSVTTQSDFAKPDSHSYSLTATADFGYVFWGWMSSNGPVTTDGETSASYDGQNPAVLWPLFIKTGSAVYFIKDAQPLTYYAYLNDAITAAGEDGTIAVYQSGTAYHSDGSTKSFTVPSGVTLLIPFDASSTLVTDNPENHLLHSYTPSLIAKSLYCQLTLEEDAQIIVEDGGVISVGSMLANQFLGQAGSYGAIYMEENSNITVESGGALFAWGYIFHGTEKKGSGTVTIESGGKVYEPMEILDYPGSASLTTTLYDNKVFPMRSYAIRNVEVPMTLCGGAMEYVFACLYGDNIGTYPQTILLISTDTVNGEIPVFQPAAETSIVKSFANGRQCIAINGDINFNSLSVTVSVKSILINKTVTMSSSDTSGFYIPSCFDLILESGTLTLNDHIIMCEGSTVTAMMETTVLSNGKNIYVLDAAEDLGAVTKTNGCSIDVKDVHGNYYTNVPSDAVLDINGTLITNGGFYTSTSGASIISSVGTGKIQLNGTSSLTSVSVKKVSDHSDVTITAAKLKNRNGQYVTTTSGTYTYCSNCMAWLCEFSEGHLGHATNVELGNGLNMYFAFWSDKIVITNGHYVIVRHGDDEIKFTSDLWQTTDIEVSDNVIHENAYVIYYKGLSAKQMNDEITVTLYDGSGNVVDKWSNSVRRYAMRMLSKHSDHETLRTLLVDMLNYGAACQNQFSYDTDHLVNAGLSAVQRSWASKSVEWSETLPNGSSSHSANLIVDGNIQFAISGVNDLSSYSFTNHWKVPRDGQEFKSADGYYYISKLYVADARQVITITAGNTTWTDSIESYCKRMIDNGNDKNGVFTAFMKFSDAAHDYLHDEENRV